MIFEGCPALTVRQPWAELIARGVKTVENRTWRTSYRGTILVHAGKKKMTKKEVERARRIFGGKTSAVELSYGAFVGSVDIVDIVDDSRDEFAQPGYYHWLLRNPKRFKDPIEYSGALSLWCPDTSVIDEVRSAKIITPHDSRS